MSPQASAPPSFFRSGKRLGYAYACAFLDGTPQPKSDEDIGRLIRLVAWDMVLEAGLDGSDPQGVFALALQTIHAISGRGDIPFELVHDAGTLTATEQFAAPPERTNPNLPINTTAQPLCRHDWRAKITHFQMATSPRLAAQPGVQANYPPPQDVLLAAAWCALTVASQMCAHAPVRLQILPDTRPGYWLLWNPVKV